MTLAQLRSAHVSASGTVLNFPTLIRYIHIYAGGTGGDVVVSVDTGQATSVNHTFTVGTSTVTAINLVDSGGLKVFTSAAITLPSTCKATILYG